MIAAFVGVTQSAVVLEEFDTGLPGDKPTIDKGRVDDSETPQRMTAGTGFSWGGKSVELWAHKAD